ncbi:MAG: NUDIX hydrolase [Candidatus Berkelbacteria bacterium]|nr:NUDIX hydrolase [Candidatus Berkelbacteria bacterium]
MENKKWKRLKTEKVFDHKFFKVNRDIVKLPDGREVDWLYWDSRDSTMIVPITADNKLVLVRQYRYLPDQIALEFPSGRSNKGEDLEDCVRRELKEETGYSCGKVIKLGDFYETMAQLNRRIHIYLAKSVKVLTGGQNSFKSAEPDEHEETEVVLLDWKDVIGMVTQGKIVSMGSSLAALLAEKYLSGKNF